MRLALAAASALALFAAPAAWADEAISTAGAGPAPTSTAEAAPLDPPVLPPSDDGEMLAVNACGVVSAPGEKPDTKAHGAVEVGIGTGGYRHVRAAMCKPIGQDGMIAVDVSHTEWSRRARFAGADTRLPQGPSEP